MDFTESEVLDRERDGRLEDSYADLPLAHRAAANGETQTLTRAIQADPILLEHQDAEGLTPLAHAVMAEQLDSLKLLVKMGASINAQDNLGRTGLAMAAYQGWLDGVVFLLRNGAQQGLPDKSGRSPLHSVTYNTETKVLLALLHNLSLDDINQQDNEGMTALHWAAFHDRPKHVQVLLQRGTDIFAQDIDGKTALHWAAQNGSGECCDRLTENPHRRELINHTDFSGKGAIHFAAAAGHSHIIRRLVRNQPDILESEDPDERTALHWAAATGQGETVTALLELNANPSPVDIEGGTPLHYAKQSGHQECVQVLEEHLGLRSQQQKIEQIAKSETGDPVKPNRNPLTFIVDLFRPKKAKHSHHAEISESEGVVTYEDSSEAVVHMDNLNHKSRTDHHSNNNSAQDSSPRSNVGTPKRPHETDVLRSMEKLQMSREDNPALGKRHNEDSHQLGELRPSHSQNIPLSGGKKVLPRTPDHSLLIRSPPPALKRDSSCSPQNPSNSALASWSQSERNRTQLEQDAAQILAIQRGIKPVTPLSESFTPLSGSSHSTLGARGSSEVDVLSRHSDLGGPVGARSHHVHLAPLKGPIPPPAIVNRHLEGVLNEPPSGNERSPTPPHWYYKAPDVDVQSSVSNQVPRNKSHPKDSNSTQHKKKKKKKTAKQNTSRSLNIQLEDANSGVQMMGSR